MQSFHTIESNGWILALMLDKVLWSIKVECVAYTHAPTMSMWIDVLMHTNQLIDRVAHFNTYWPFKLLTKCMTLNKFYHSISTLFIPFLHPSLLFPFSQVPSESPFSILPTPLKWWTFTKPSHPTLTTPIHHPYSTSLKMMDIHQKKTVLVKIIHLEKKLNILSKCNYISCAFH